MSHLTDLARLLLTTSEGLQQLAIDPFGRTKMVTPLISRFPEVWTRSGGRPRCKLLRSGPFLRDRFGVDLQVGASLVHTNLMPSSIQRLTAQAVAPQCGMDITSALNFRPTRGVRDLLDEIDGRLRVGTLLISALWRFPGSADVLWLALRDEAQRVREQLQPGGGE